MNASVGRSMLEDEPLLKDREEIKVFEKESRIQQLRKCAEPYVIVLAICGILNFMVCLVTYQMDYETSFNATALWIPTKCTLLLKACSCECCMIKPAVPCRCPVRFTHPSRCSLWCPLNNSFPLLNGECKSEDGDDIQTIDSYWYMGHPSCLLRFRRSALVEYSINSQVYTSAVYLVSCDCLY